MVERGMEKAGEHGPGVGGSIGRLTRVRPLLRFEAEFSANQGGTTIYSSLHCKGVFLHLLSLLLEEKVSAEQADG